MLVTLPMSLLEEFEEGDELQLCRRGCPSYERLDKPGLSPVNVTAMSKEKVGSLTLLLNLTFLFLSLYICQTSVYIYINSFICFYLCPYGLPVFLTCIIPSVSLCIRLSFCLILVLFLFNHNLSIFITFQSVG